ncbi:MAG: hypothetical protein COB04_15965 [Gammaproteobacteria bacterium]|nr:MAG: hypothetical protein COB04_15965 [Gammaproteobacteria bacterium]
MANVLIIGCGDIGQHTAARLIKNQHNVFGLRRSPPTSTSIGASKDLHANTPAAIHWITADLTRPETLEQLTDQFEYILYMPAPKRSADASLEQTYRSVFLEGLTHVIAKAEQFQKLKRFIFISSVSVFGQNQGSWVNENEPPLPKRFNGEILLEAEQRIGQASFPSSTVRLAGIYGPGRHRLIDNVSKGCRIQSEPPKYTNRIHSHDCAELLNFLIQQDLQDTPLQPLYVGVDDHPCSEQEINQWIFQRLNEYGQNPNPYTIDNTATAQNKRCSNQAIKSLGYQFIYPSYQTGYVDVIKDYVNKQQNTPPSEHPTKTKS